MSDDVELLRRYREERSQPAMEELFRRYRDLVYSSALRQTGDSHLSEDVTQAAFLILAEKASTIRNGVALGGWLITVTRRAAMHVMRQHEIQVRHERHAARIDRATKDADTSWNLIAGDIDAALAELSDSDRDVIVLRFFQDNSLAHVGHELGISEDAARKRVTRALDRLRTRLSRGDVALGASDLAALISAHAVRAAPATLALKGSAAASGIAKAVARGAFLRRHLLLKVLSALLVLVVAGLVFLPTSDHPGGASVVKTTQPDAQQVAVTTQASMPVLPTAAIVNAVAMPVIGRTMAQISAELRQAAADFNNAVADRYVFATPESRKAVVPSVMAAVNRISSLHRELGAMQPTAKPAIAQAVTLMNIVRVAIEDPLAVQANGESIAAGGSDGALAKAIRGAADYLDAAQNSGAQMLAVDEIQAAYSQLAPDAPVNLLPGIFEKNPPADDATIAKITTLLNNDTHSRLSMYVVHDLTTPDMLATIRTTTRPMIMTRPAG